MKDTNQLPEPELGYIKTDKSNQPAFSARQMREMKGTNQLPPSEREAFEAFAQNCPMGKYSIARRGDGYDSSHTQLMWDAWQARAQVQGEPVGFTYQAEIEYADSTGGNGSFWRVPPDLDDEAVPLYTHPAPNVPADVMRDAERYRWLRDNWFTMGASYPEDTVKFHLGNARWSEQPESNLDAAIDAAMLAPKDSK